MLVFRNLDHLSLVVYCNTTLLQFQTVLFLFLSKFYASKSGCGLSMDVAYTQMFNVILNALSLAHVQCSYITLGTVVCLPSMLN